MELRQLTCFTTLARELHYGRAAAQLFISQPALSKHIASFERELGVQLFQRTRRSVALSAAGRLLLPEAERIAEMCQRFEQHATTVRAGRLGELRLGYTGTVAMGGMADVLGIFRDDCPDVITSLREATTKAVLDDVADGIFDAAFVRYVDREASDLAVTLLRTEPAILAVAPGHPFADREQVRFAEMAGQSMVMMTRQVEPQLYDHAIGLCAGAGFSPSIVHEADSLQTTLTMVSSGIGVAVVPRSAMALAGSGAVAVRLVEPTPAVSLRLVHRRDNQSPVLAAFLLAGGRAEERWRRDDDATEEAVLREDL
jgi:DNA-binding transcriptional LysR family regulator